MSATRMEIPSPAPPEQPAPPEPGPTAPDPVPPEQPGEAPLGPDLPDPELPGEPEPVGPDVPAPDPRGPQTDAGHASPMTPTPEQAESADDRHERQLGELLAELRVAMPGVQLLFAFLLVVPFNQRFGEATGFQRTLYAVVLMCAAFASALFIAPSAYHRLMFHRGDRPRLIRMATHMAIGGLAFLALAMTGAVLLVTDFLFGAPVSAVCTAAVFCAFAWLWFGLALMRRHERPPRA